MPADRRWQKPIWLRRIAAWSFEQSPQVRRLRRAITELAAGDSVLELGCGFGQAAGWCPGRYLGLDRDPAVVAEAQRQHPGSEFRATQASTSGVAPGEFQVVLLCLMLHETGEREAVLAEAARLSPERIAVLDFDPDMPRFDRWRTQLLEERHFSSYLAFDLQACLGQLGWKLEATQAVSRMFRAWCFVPGLPQREPLR